jgi:hypothetical protein
MAVRLLEWGWVLVGMFAVAACSSGDSKPQKRDLSTLVIPENVTEAEFASLINDLGCNAVAHCCAASGGGYDSVTCTVRFADTFGFYPRPHFSFSSATATQCLKALQKDAVGCDGLPAACREIYRGSQRLGSPCALDKECESTPEQELICDVLAGGVCKARNQGKLGDPCDQTCPANGERYTTCADTFVHGSPALPENTHVACARARGLYCDSSTAQCKALVGVGSSCSDTTQCAAGSWCTETKEGTAVQAATCQQRAIVGLPCVSPLECAGNAYCGSDGLCHAPQSKADGEACSSSLECAGTCEQHRCTAAAFPNGFLRSVAKAICGGSPS